MIHDKIYSNILELIGNTPIVQLQKITKELPGTYLAKLESFNPGGSMKDRIAFHIIENAEKMGLLKPGSTIVETTSAGIPARLCLDHTTEKAARGLGHAGLPNAADLFASHPERSGGGSTRRL